MSSDTLNLFAPTWNAADSYGRLARELAAGLRRQGMIVNAFGHQSPKKPIKFVMGGLILGWPTAIQNFGPLANIGPRVAVTMFESTALPFLWADTLNTMQAVVVPSKWNVEVFRDSGVTVPIHVVPLGISRAFKWMPRPKHTTFNVLAIADSGGRKGWDIAAQAFVRAFGDSLNHHLVLKGRPGALGLARISNRNIHLVEANLSDKRLASLYGDMDCMIFPSAGEGFGLPPREFAATGGTVIATNFGGTADDLTQWGLPINYSMVSAWKGHETLAGVGEWAAPDVDDLAATMTQVAAHASYYAERGRAASAFVTKHYRWGAFAKTLAQIWQQAMVDYAARPRIMEVAHGNRNPAQPIPA